MFNRFWSLGLAAIIMQPAVVSATVKGDVVARCPETIRALCEARDLEEEAARNAALLRLFPEALQSTDREVRHAAFGFLCDIYYERRFDPRALHEALLQFDRLEDQSAGASLVDEAEYRYASRELRLSLCEKALVDGRARLGEVSALSRSSAMWHAASEGMGELRALIEKHFPEVDEQSKTLWPLGYLLVTLELRSGAEDAADAVLCAARRLAEEPAPQLWARLEGSRDWQRAYRETTEEACKVTASQACELMKSTNAGLQAVVEPLLKAETERRHAQWNPRDAAPPQGPSPRESLLVEWSRLTAPHE